MKWIRQVLLKIQSGHDSVHRRTDGQTDGRTDGQGESRIPLFQLRGSGGYNHVSKRGPRWIYVVLAMHNWWSVDPLSCAYYIVMVVVCFIIKSFLTYSFFTYTCFTNHMQALSSYMHLITKKKPNGHMSRYMHSTKPHNGHMSSYMHSTKPHNGHMSSYMCSTKNPTMDTCHS